VKYQAIFLLYTIENRVDIDSWVRIVKVRTSFCVCSFRHHNPKESKTLKRLSKDFAVSKFVSCVTFCKCVPLIYILRDPIVACAETRELFICPHGIDLGRIKREIIVESPNHLLANLPRVGFPPTTGVRSGRVCEYSWGQSLTEIFWECLGGDGVAVCGWWLEGRRGEGGEAASP
jgi:hypothetical protein